LVVDNNSDLSSPEINISQTQNNYIASTEMGFGDYYWKVRAFDGYNYSNWSTTRNFTIIMSISCSLPVNSISFGTIMSGQTKDTSTNNPLPLIIENKGNVKLNISINATNIWQSQQNPSTYYRFRIGENESGSFDNAITSWTNMPLAPLQAITNLKYNDASDDARIDIRISGPPDEGAGEKSSNISIWCEVGE